MLSASRSLRDKVIFGLSLLGLLVVIHLWIQEQRGFDQGCWGFNPPDGTEQTFDCQAVLSSQAGTVFGISNVWFGLLFYLGVAVLTFIGSRPAPPVFIPRARTILVIVGFLYSVYLVVYQFFFIKEYCALCLTSAGIVTLLFILHVLPVPESPRPLKRAKDKPIVSSRFYLVLVAVVICVAGADLLYFSRLEKSPADAAPSPTTALAGESTEAADCAFDETKPSIPNYATLVRDSDPKAGKLDAPVTVIEYFDPNCPHCIQTYPEMERLVQQMQDSARFVFKPIVIFKQYSVEPVVALHEAANAGKFFEMLELQMGTTREGVLTAEALQDYINRVGLNTDEMFARIRSGTYNILLNQDERLFLDAGLTSVPAVIINGRIVASRSRNTACMSRLIRQAYPTTAQ